jgi:hypothetical protein
MTESKLKLLHHRSTIGETLTAGERAALKAWYAENDAKEAKTLEKALQGDPAKILNEQLPAVARQLVAAARQFQEIIATNAELRREILALKSKRSRKSADCAA